MTTLNACYHGKTAYLFQNRQDKVKEAHPALGRIDARNAEEFEKICIKR